MINKKYITEFVIMALCVILLCYIKFIGVPNWIMTLPKTSNADFAILLVITLLIIVTIFLLPTAYKGQNIIKLKFFSILTSTILLIGLSYYIITIGIP